MKRLALSVTLLLVVAACGDDASTTTTTTSTTTTTTTTPTTTTTAAPQVTEPAGGVPCGSTASPPAGLMEYALTSGGIERTYFVHLPEGYDSASEWPVIVALHALNTRADKWFDETWKASASEIDYVLVLPEALRLNWRDRSFEPDVPFITDVLTELGTKVCIDPARIYASGASDGADMVTRLACGAGDRFAAMRPYVGMNYPELFESEGCDQPGPVPMTSYIGTDEPYYDLAGIDEGVAMWAERNGCQGEPVTEEVADGVTATRYDDCIDGAIVEIYLLEGVAHEAAQIECEGNGPGFCITYSFDTTGSMLEFFSQYSR